MSTSLAVLVCAVRYLGTTNRIGVRIAFERRRIVTRILQRLAQREAEMQALVVIQIQSLQLRAHRCDIGLVEAHGLQVGQAPPGTSEAGVDVQRASIGNDRAIGVPFGL